MTFFYPLKKLSELDKSEVGLYAKEFAKLERAVNIPFSLVLNYRIFNDFIVHNGLQELVSENPSSDSERVDFFHRISEAFFSANFPSNVVADLKECFELVSLDTTNLSSLTDLAKEQSIISIYRGVDYEDNHSVCPKVLFTKNEFFSFLDFIKSSFISLFCPDSVKYRQEHNIDSFRVGLVISRLPPFQFSFKSTYQPDKIIVDSYLGFIDLTNSVIKNRFFLAKDFLKIEDRDIKRQETVSVFSLEENKPFVKTYISSSSSSQIVPDNVILEIGRLTKRVAESSAFEEFSLTAVSGKNAQPTVLFFEPKIEEQKIKEEQDEEQIVEEKNVEEEKDNFNQENSSNNNEEVLNVSVEDIFKSDETIKLVESIKKFLEHNKNNNLSSSIDLVLRSLDNEISFDSINSSLDIIKDILKLN